MPSAARLWYSEKMQKRKRGGYSLSYSLRGVWRHVRAFRLELFILSGLGIISAAANGTIPFLTGRFFDALIQVAQGTTEAGYGGLPLWGTLLAAWAGAQLIANNIDWIIDRLGKRIDIQAHLSIQANGFKQLYQLPLSFHRTERINTVLEQIGKAGWRISSIINVLISLAPQLLSIVIGLTLAATINLMLTGILAAGVVLYLALLGVILRPIARIDEKAHELWNEGWGDAAASVHQIDAVKQAAAEEYESKKVTDALLKNAYSYWIRLMYNWSNVNFFQRTIVFFTQLTVFILSVHLVASGALTVGELVALNGYALMFFGPFARLGHQWQVIQNGLTSAAEAEEVFRTAQERYVPDDPVTAKNLRGEVRFDSVSFRYEPRQPEVLTDISFVANPGEVVALVGPTGVGKSTVISLISGYYFPTDGVVEIDGVDIRRYPLSELRAQIGVVPQEVALFNETIYDNIRYGTFTATKEAVIEAAKQAHIHEFVMTLPDGYDTLVGERGIKLSVGQKQRVAIARAILRDPTILILDEPTSALDAQTEQYITEALEKLMKDRTTFVIAHRLSTVRKANTILVFDKGQIVECGTHEELLKKNGVYRRLHDYQIGLH